MFTVKGYTAYRSLSKLEAHHWNLFIKKKGNNYTVIFGTQVTPN